MHYRGAEGRERGEKEPAAAQGDQDQPGVENGDVAEEAERVVLAGGNQDGGEEAAEHPENGNDHRVETDRQHESRDRNERHQEKGWDWSEELEFVNRVAGECDRVKDNDSGRAEGLGKRRWNFARHHHAAGEDPKTNEEAGYRLQLM